LYLARICPCKSLVFFSKKFLSASGAFTA
jgi:hypothetical protein